VDPLQTRRLNGMEIKEVVYTSKSELKHPIKLLKTMFKDLVSSWELARSLLSRDLNAKYRQSILGYLWAFLPALVTSLTFTLANKSQTIKFEETGIPYPAFVIFGMVIWQTFVEAINGPVQTISDSKVMLAKINFKREALVLSKFLEVWFSFSIKVLLIIVVFIYFRIHIEWTVIFAPLALSVLILLGILIGLFLSPFSLLFKDISYALAIFINLFLFISPVIFPKPTSGLFATVVNFNPVTHLMEAIRSLTLGAEGFDFSAFYITSGITLALLFVAWLTFRLAMPFAIERVTS
jgi:lipopolysaccharide transport system permease protein